MERTDEETGHDIRAVLGHYNLYKEEMACACWSRALEGQCVECSVCVSVGLPFGFRAGST